MTKTTHGGAGRGQGRKPLADDAPSVVVTLRMTPTQRDELRALGGGAWVRAQIEKFFVERSDITKRRTK